MDKSVEDDKKYIDYCRVYLLVLYYTIIRCYVVIFIRL